MTDTIGSLLGATDDGPNDKRDANQYIIDSIPFGNFGTTSPLINQPNATKIRFRLAAALGMTDEELSAKIANFYRTGEVAHE